MSVTVRPRRPDDLVPVVAVFLGCWRETYAARLPASLVAAMSDATATDLWRRALAGDRETGVAILDGSVCGVVGFAVDGDVGWVHSLYVAPAAQGSGVGSVLLAYASARLDQAGCRRAQLWVFADNHPSIAFYGRHGWRPDGASRVEEAFGENEIRLSRTAVTTS